MVLYYMSSNIKTVLNEYIKLDDELKILNKQSTALRIQKKSLAEQINSYLESSKNGSADAILEMGKNTFKLIKYTKKKVSKVNIEDILKKKISDEVKVRSIIDDITEETEESYIKRTIKK
jgi:hypothetical protein